MVTHVTRGYHGYSKDVTRGYHGPWLHRLVGLPCLHMLQGVTMVTECYLPEI